MDKVEFRNHYNNGVEPKTIRVKQIKLNEMKHLIIIFLAVITVNLTYGQANSKEKELSKAEQFATKVGTLIKKKFIDVGTIKKVEIKVIHCTDMISAESISSVRFEYELTSSHTFDIRIATIDADEIDGLIRAIKIMQEKVFTTTPINHTEVTYKSRDGFEVGCYWRLESWIAYLKLKKDDEKSYVFLKKDDYTKLLTLLEKAKALLK